MFDYLFFKYFITALFMVFGGNEDSYVDMKSSLEQGLMKIPEYSALKVELVPLTLVDTGIVVYKPSERVVKQPDSLRYGVVMNLVDLKGQALRDTKGKPFQIVDVSDTFHIDGIGAQDWAANYVFSFPVKVCTLKITDLSTGKLIINRIEKTAPYSINGDNGATSYTKSSLVAGGVYKHEFTVTGTDNVTITKNSVLKLKPRELQYIFKQDPLDVQLVFHSKYFEIYKIRAMEYCFVPSNFAPIIKEH